MTVVGENTAEASSRPARLWPSKSLQRAFLPLLLVVVALAVYNPTAHNGFVFFDDSPYILKNAHVRNGLTWDTIKWSFSTFYSANWHPLTWLSHALDCQLFGLNPAGSHYVSLLFHTANAVLVLLILELATGLPWPSLMVAALFVLHPLNVESVAWAAERKNVLSMFFCLLSLLAYTRYARSGRLSSYLSTWVFFGLALMAKPQVITLPFLLLLWDYWPLNRMFPARADANASQSGVDRPLASLIWEKTPLFVLSAASAVVTLIAQRAGSAVRTLTELSLSARIENSIVSYARYIADVFWPAKLAPLYPHPGNSLPAWQVTVSILLLLLVTVLVIRRRNHRYLLVGWLWFLGALFPTIGLIQVGEQAMADRYMYLPLLGILIGLVWSGVTFSAGNESSQKWLASLALIALAALGFATYRQIGHWRDGETLWRYTLSVTRNNYMAHDNLAMVFAEEGRADEAISEFRAAEGLHNYPAPQVLSLGAYEQRNGHLQGAIEQYSKALQVSNDPAVKVAAWDSIASACSQAKEWDRTKNAYDAALVINPNDPNALLGTGLLAIRGGDLDLALKQFSRAMNVAPTDIGMLLQSDVLRRMGRGSEADAAYARARNLSSDFDQTRQVTNQLVQSFDIASL